MIINEVHADTTAVARAARWRHVLPSVAAVVVDLLVMTGVTLAAATLGRRWLHRAARAATVVSVCTSLMIMGP